MSSLKVPAPKLKLPLPLQSNTTSYICPSNTFSNRIPADPRVSITDRPDITSTIMTGQQNIFSEQVSESVVEPTLASELSESEVSLLQILEEGHMRQNKENFLMEYLRNSEEESRLKEEVNMLKKDLIMKSSLIEKLINENESLRKEMEEVLSAVEDAKEKINIKMNGYNQRIQELENQVKDLTEENKNYQEQLTKINSNKEGNNRQGLKKLDNNILPTLSEQINVYANPSKILLQSCSNLLQNQSPETIKDGNIKVKSRHGSPTHVRPSNLSISKPKPVSQGRNLRPSVTNNSPIAPERAGAVNNCNRRTKMLTIHHIQDTVLGNKSENNCVGGFSSSDFGGMRRSPKAVFTPKMKVKMIGYEFDDV